jgi:hypothetical protein
MCAHYTRHLGARNCERTARLKIEPSRYKAPEGTRLRRGSSAAQLHVLLAALRERG